MSPAVATVADICSTAGLVGVAPATTTMVVANPFAITTIGIGRTFRCKADTFFHRVQIAIFTGRAFRVGATVEFDTEAIQAF